MLLSQYFPYLSFQKFECLSVDFFVFILLEIPSISWLCTYISCQIWEVISHFFFESSLFSSDVINVISFVIVPKVPEILLISLKSFSLYCPHWIFSIVARSSLLILSPCPLFWYGDNSFSVLVVFFLILVNVFFVFLYIFHLFSETFYFFAETLFYYFKFVSRMLI